MNKELLLVVDAVANAKSIPRSAILEALEQAMASAVRKNLNETNIDVRAEMDAQTGNFLLFKRRLMNPDALDESGKILSIHDAQDSDIVEEALPKIAFSRISAQTAKQVILQKVREAVRIQLARQYESSVGELMVGMVKQVGREELIVAIDNDVETSLPRSQLLTRDKFRVGDRIRAVLFEIDIERRGHQLLLSRIHPQMVVALFSREVPEIIEQIIEIKSIARDPGIRAKIAVRSKDKRIDPVGACVGMRGSRVQVIMDELKGERIDIIEWDEQIGQFSVNALMLKEVQSVLIDEEKHTIDVAVKDQELALAIGRGGQNVRLASELTGWTLTLMSENEAQDKHQQENQKVIDYFIKHLNVDADIAAILVREGFDSLEGIAYADIQEMLDIADFDEALITALQARAREVLLNRALTGEENTIDSDLLEIEGMDAALAEELVVKGITDREKLAELASDELMELSPMAEDKARALIIAAREYWFTEATI